jgi:hypothetical protein
MNRGVIVLTLAALAAAAGAACSSTSPAQACTDISNAVCAKIEACAPAAISGLYGDTATCAQRTESTCNAALALKNTGDEPGNVEDCSKAYASLSCTDALGNTLPKECAHKPGPLGDGTTCGAAGQCKSGVRQFDTTGCGKCIEPIAAGANCNATSDCASGLVCAISATTQTSVTSVCIAPAATGGTCSTKVPIVPCQAGLVCDAGKCAAPLAANSACDPAVQPTLCDQANGYFCTPRGTRCILAIAAGTGAACGYNIQTGDYSYCTGSGFCGNIDQQTGMGTCIAPAADGTACDIGKGPLCTPPAVCTITTDGGTTGNCTVKDPSSCQ